MKPLFALSLMLPIVCYGQNGYITNYPKAHYYVCYEKRIKKVEPLWPDKTIYQGCLKSATPCLKLNKNLFQYGQYATKEQAENAHTRCMRSHPMFRHPKRLA